MTSVSLPLTFHAIGNSELKTPVKDLELTVSDLQVDDLLIKVAYASINPMDPKLQLYNFWSFPLPLILGFDFSGTVVAVGSDEAPPHSDAAVKVGSEVFGFASKGGCFAEYAVVKRAGVAQRRSIPLAEAATYGIAYCTAYESLEVVGEVSKRAGQWLFVPGAAGGVGHFAVQLGKAAGMRVIGSTSKATSADLLRHLGVDHVIDYSKQDVVKEVLRITGGLGVDLVYDPSYKASSFTQSAATVAKGGVWMKLGGFNDEDAEARRVAEERGGKAVFGDFGRYWFQPEFQPQLWRMREALDKAEVWYSEGKVKAHVGAVIPAEAKALQQALDDSASGKLSTGKPVVKVAKH